MRIRLALISLLALVAVAIGCWRSRPPTWQGIDAGIARDHPQLTRIEDSALAAWLRDPSRRQPALVDVRSREEVAVSHLPGAITPEAAERLDHDRPIVTYCSVGVRSSAFADHLRAEGFASVDDLRGGIFGWANAGHPLERDGAPTRVVHPYDARWGRLLSPELRASSPSPP